MHINTDEDSFIKKFETTRGSTQLTKLQKAINTIKSQTRNDAERVFGNLKLHYGMTKARYLGLKHFNTNTLLASIAHHVKTSVSMIQKYSLVRGYIRLIHVF